MSADRPRGPGGPDAWPTSDTLDALVARRLDDVAPPQVKPSPVGSLGVTAQPASADLPHPPAAALLIGVFAGGRGADVRLARLHLRGGLLPLARAELEQMAGVGALDREALVDLAEARWRCGDLEGAAEAAEAHLAAGGDEPMAHVIAAEEADRQGRLVDARRHAAQVREQLGPGLDRLFAGEPRSTAWPLEVPDWMDGRATAGGRWGLLVGGAEVASPDPDTWPSVPPPVAPPRSVGGPAAGRASAAMTAASSTLDQIEVGRAAGAELATAELDLAAGRLEAAVARFALVLRYDPALGPVILTAASRVAAAAGPHHPVRPALDLLRGDAYRSLGMDAEATDAYADSMRALEARPILKESS